MRPNDVQRKLRNYEHCHRVWSWHDIMLLNFMMLYC